eukprot:TRINITY_DN52096_c0_g1_i2.p4 TRINITY_DN52096_c0_g1~~TRINITY_DN52096_c0_g1_i2.p4  ORF type:complete len:132 (+),score=14.72 TRINITY_DN52096_c0_g1_i2:525-920(+)
MCCHIFSMYRVVIEIERNLMEGLYNKLLKTRAVVPSNEYLVYMDMLQDTIRSEIGSCCAEAYDQIEVEGAQKLLMLDSKEEVKKWAAQQEKWNLEGDKFKFTREKLEERLVPFDEIACQTLGYATEMERIV